MAKNLSKEEEQEIVELCGESTAKEVSAKYGISTDRIYRIWRKHKEDTPCDTIARLAAMEKKIEEILELLREKSVQDSFAKEEILDSIRDVSERMEKMEEMEDVEEEMEGLQDLGEEMEEKIEKEQSLLESIQQLCSTCRDIWTTSIAVSVVASVAWIVLSNTKWYTKGPSRDEDTFVRYKNDNMQKPPTTPRTPPTPPPSPPPKKVQTMFEME